MKADQYTTWVCRHHCRFYKEGKEELLCETYRYLRDNYSPVELSEVPPGIQPDFLEDDWIMENVCKRCEFLIDGCDYREGNPSPPCGGYVVIEWLRKHIR